MAVRQTLTYELVGGTFPFNPVLDNPQEEFISFLKDQSSEFSKSLKRKLRGGTQSRHGRPRLESRRRRTGIYMASRTFANVAPDYLSWSITMHSNHALAYETTHHYMTKELLEMAGTS